MRTRAYIVNAVTALCLRAGVRAGGVRESAWAAAGKDVVSRAREGIPIR